MLRLKKQRGAVDQGRDGHLRRRISRSAFSAFAILSVVGAALWSVLMSMENVHSEHTHRLTAIEMYKVVDPPAVAAKITNSDTTTNTNTTTNTTTTTNTASKEEFARYSHQLVQAPSDSSITHQDMDAMCTLKRYPRLLEHFCPVERPSCYLKAFRAHFASHRKRENLVGGCPLNEAVCYVKRYPELFHEYCNDSETKCDYYSLRDHYEQQGMKEKRAWGCDFSANPSYRQT
jgi:hypothetical protein